VERLRNILNRSMLRRKLITWAENTWVITCLDDGLWKATKTIERRRLRNAFETYRQQVREDKRQELILGKCEWLIQKRHKKTFDNVYDAWVGAIKRFKTGKVFLLRAIKGVDRLIANEAFTLWKGANFQARRDVYHSNIAELQRRQRGHEQQI
jgi:hypothetical protein